MYSVPGPTNWIMMGRVNGGKPQWPVYKKVLADALQHMEGLFSLHPLRGRQKHSTNISAFQKKKKKKIMSSKHCTWVVL